MRSKVRGFYGISKKRFRLTLITLEDPASKPDSNNMDPPRTQTTLAPLPLLNPSPSATTSPERPSSNLSFPSRDKTASCFPSGLHSMLQTPSPLPAFGNWKASEPESAFQTSMLPSMCATARMSSALGCHLMTVIFSGPPCVVRLRTKQVFLYKEETFNYVSTWTMNKNSCPCSALPPDKSWTTNVLTQMTAG